MTVPQLTNSRSDAPVTGTVTALPRPEQEPAYGAQRVLSIRAIEALIAHSWARAAMTAMALLLAVFAHAMFFAGALTGSAITLEILARRSSATTAR